jgi:HEAT repeat protein
VAIYAASKDRLSENVRATLAYLVNNFEVDAAGSRKLIREILDNTREVFFATALEIVKSAPDTRGGQFLLALMASNGMLLEALCDPALSSEQALQLAHAAKRADPLVDTLLARGLADSAVGSGPVVISNPARMMEILCEIADPTRVTSSLMRLLRHPNPYLRSKAVKMIGRGNRSVKWVQGRLKESDPRIRANAVESLWGVETQDARALLNFALNDGNNRVVGNALLGLYHLGDPSALAEINKLAQHSSVAFRSTAAWVMSETADPRFSDALRRLISESDPVLRKRAFTGLSRIKNALAQPPAGAEWHMAGRILTGETLKGMRRAVLSVVSGDFREVPKVMPLQFLLSEGGQYITNYDVRERAQAEMMNVIFVIPRSREAAGGAFFEGVLRCLAWKRPSDLWCILPYLETGDGEIPEPQEAGAAEFTAKSEALAAVLNGIPKRLECADLWTTLWRCARTDLGQSRGKRHVFVFSSVEEGRVAGHGLVANFQNGRIPLHVIGSAPNAELQEFCNRIRTPYHLCVPEEISESVQHNYLNLLARYEIVYQPVSPEPAPLKMRVQTATGWGETVIPIEARS